MVSSIFLRLCSRLLLLFLRLLLCSLPWVVVPSSGLLRVAGSGYPLVLDSVLINDRPVIEDEMTTVVRWCYIFLALLSWQWRDLGMCSWSSGTGDPIGGLVYAGGIFDADVGSLVGWKWSMVVLGIYGGDKTCCGYGCWVCVFLGVRVGLCVGHHVGPITFYSFYKVCGLFFCIGWSFRLIN